MNIDEEITGALSRQRIQTHQLSKLNELLAAVRTRPFYQQKWSHLQLPLHSLDELVRIPLLTKDELVDTKRAAAARIFDLPSAEYSRLHQTSGTTGYPMAVLDTAQDWQWWMNCWDHVLDAAKVIHSDVAMMAFSFGPFIGFWTANDALIRRGAMVVPAGGLSSENRLRMIQDYQCTIVCCTPTYALHLATIADKHGIDLAALPVERIIVAGEPGGSVPVIRGRIEQAWGASVIDHAGASEIGAWGFGSADGKGLHVIETEFITEVLSFTKDTVGHEVGEGESGELVLTSLGRFGGPVIRYRTGDIVRRFRRHSQPSPFLWLDGGVLGRSDDMMVIRGVNIFPASIESIIREIEPKAEFRMIATRIDEMDQLEIEIECDRNNANRLSELLKDRLAMRVNVKTVPAESLTRFEAKARRLVDRRKKLGSN